MCSKKITIFSDTIDPITVLRFCGMQLFIHVLISTAVQLNRRWSQGMDE